MEWRSFSFAFFLLFFLFGPLNVHGRQRGPFEKVLKRMRRRELECPTRFDPNLCYIAREQGRRSETEQRACDHGIKMARGQPGCKRPFFSGFSWRTEISQVCCDCCVFGLMAANVRSSCEVPGLTLGKQCSDTAKTCCEQPEEVQPSVEGRKNEPEVSTPTSAAH